MSRIVLLVSLSLSLLLISACFSQAPIDPLVQAGSKHFGEQGTFITFEVPTEEERPFLLSRGTPASRRLTEVFSLAKRSVVQIIIGGPSSEATKKAILAAFANHRGQLLGGLELVFVGDLVDARQVAKAAKPHLATVHFSSLAALIAKQQ